MGYLLTVPVLWSLELFGVQKCFLWIIKRVGCRYCTASMSGFIATYFYPKFHQFWPRRVFPISGALKTEVTVGKKVVNSRKFFLMEDFHHYVFWGPRNIFSSTGGGPEQGPFLSLSKRCFLFRFHGLFTYYSSTMITWTFWCAKGLPSDYQKS